MKDKLALIAVFKKEVEAASAEAMLSGLQVKYRKGMDSSRGKLYFYSTGPKFILTFETEADKERIRRALDDAGNCTKCMSRIGINARTSGQQKNIFQYPKV
ncbi:hypothetical protein MKQ70_18015 [Chitinophaga sedimenti]|uniref:hypothetical protein n=1 Tax=Chitinophaga sedimenti TaxID=2033606 RepID=UPI002006A2C9|nr:hypothetical protein [Chitinophaga sedimenti]MCK7556811.1 hypothetical protein [Chitinophaga sedimenti]